MAELADALDLGSSGESRAGSTPVIRTPFKRSSIIDGLLFFVLFELCFLCVFNKYKRRYYCFYIKKVVKYAIYGQSRSDLVTQSYRAWYL